MNALGMMGRHMAPGILLETIVYILIGLAFFALAIWLMEKVTPFSLRKELEEDQNVAIGIIVGSVIIGISIIVASVLGS